MRTSLTRSGLARTAATAAALASVLVLAGAATGQAAPAAQTAPGFLEADELPAHPHSPWYAGDVTPGLPDIVPFCADAPSLPAESTSHRLFHTELDTGAEQVTVVAEDAAAAEQLATALRTNAAECAANWLRDNPGGTASWRDLGPLDTGDGAHVYGVHIEADYGAQDVHLFGIGRDGETVTFVRWGQMGTFEGIPTTGFKTTVRTAVEKLND